MVTSPSCAVDCHDLPSRFSSCVPKPGAAFRREAWAPIDEHPRRDKPHEHRDRVGHEGHRLAAGRDAARIPTTTTVTAA